MNWVNIKDKPPTNGKYYLICSDCGWIGLQKYENNSWCPTDYPDVICDNVLYDVSNNEIKYYIEVKDIPIPFESK